MGTIESSRHTPSIIPNAASVPVGGLGEDVVEGKSETAAPLLARTGFCVGDWNLLFPSSFGREVIPAPPVSRVPNTAPWLLGLANARGNLIPIVDMAMAFGAARAAGISAYVLVFGQSETAMGLLVDGLPHLLSLEESERMTGTPPLPPLLEGNIVAAYRHGSRTWLDLDVPRFFETLAQAIAR